jgi:integrase
MGRRHLHRLTDLACEKAKPKPDTKARMLADGGSLYLLVRSTDDPKKPSKSWVFRFGVSQTVTSAKGKTYNRQRLMGLGAYPDVSLAKARDLASQCRKLRKDGLDPIKQREAQRSARAAEEGTRKTFDECREGFIEKQSVEWGNAKYAKQVRSQLARYVSPIIGKFWVGEIDKRHVIEVLEQYVKGRGGSQGKFWTSKPDTAKKVRDKIEGILDWAVARGHRLEGPNPARWKGNLEHSLASHGRSDRHHPSLPYDQMPEFMADLRSQTAPSAAGLEFLILTGCRVNEVTQMLGEEIDFAKKLWTIPRERMGKSKLEQRVPLSDRALELVAHTKPGERAFPLSNETWSRLLDRMNKSRQRSGLPRYVDPGQQGRHVVPHGFRASAETWAEEETSFDRATIEAALGHTGGLKAEAASIATDDQLEDAYNRGDRLAKRRKLMEAWATYCAGAPATANVVALKR